MKFLFYLAPFVLLLALDHHALGAAAQPLAATPIQVNGAADLPVTLTVRDTAPGGRARALEPVTSGVPLPMRAGVVDPDSLVLTDDQGNVVPAQFTVLARWNGPITNETLKIRWVLVDFQADVSASGARDYVLSKIEDARSKVENPIEITEHADRFLIDTGAARFSVSRRYFNLFDQVWAGRGEGALVVDQVGRGGVVLVDGEGKRFSSLNAPPESIEVEESGPLRSVVRVRGVLRAEDGTYFAPPVNNSKDWPRFSQPYEHSFVYYNCRIHFYAGKDYVRVFFTLENNGANGRTNPEQYFAPIQAVYFDSLSLELNLAEQKPALVTSAGLQERLEKDDLLSILQNWRETDEPNRNGTLESSFAKGAFFSMRKGEEKVKEGQTHPGWLRLKGDSAEVGLAVRHYWQNFPKKIVAGPGRLRVDLWPEEGYYPHCRSEDFPEEQHDMYCRQAGRDVGLYLFDGGRHKTHEMLLAFAVPGEGTDPEALHAAVEHPLMALASPAWYSDTGGLGMIAPGGLSIGDAALDEALDRYDRLQVAMVDEDVSQNEWTINTLKTRYPARWSYTRQYRYFGWMGFGDLLWSNQTGSALHYDWPYSMLLHYLRTGHRGLFDAGVEMAKHRYDIDQYHGERRDSRGNHVWTNHMAFYELDRHSDPSIGTHAPARVSMNSHTWNGGLVLYYLLTGDRKAWEAAKANGQAAFNRLERRSLSQGCADHETRQETWPILNLVNLYRVNGDPGHLEVARNIAVNRVLYREQRAGGRGLFGAGRDCDAIDGSRQSSVMFSYAIDPLIQIHYETGDGELGELLVRMADFTKDLFLFGGDVDGEGKYRPLQSPTSWRQGDAEDDKKGEPIKNVFWADLLAYAYHLTGEVDYLHWARHVFRDAMFYYTIGGNRYIDPTRRSRISFIDGMFASSETKAHGWIGRTNQVYLHTEYTLGTDR
ncbi:glycoside hydrolase family 127 protein [Geoalkalibacter halelectricus]|nr:glycoside hydrolase family 127 protein [Geoalkalibacter halelectricus]